MKGILNALFEKFYEPVHDPELEDEIARCHEELIRRLSKEERKLVLQIIDAKDNLACAQAAEGFIAGFRLAWSLFVELCDLRKPWEYHK